MTATNASTGTDAPILIDIFHDTVCPWCRIGITSLEKAIAAWDGPPIQLHWHPFLLNPDEPMEGEPFLASLSAKFGQDPAPMLARVAEAGQALGLTFNWDRVTRAPNSILSHLLYAILPDDRRTAMIERIQTAYFEEGRDIGDVPTLLGIAREAGMDTDLTEIALNRAELRDAITSEARQATESGVTAVPLFIVDGLFAVNGAQGPVTFTQVLEQVMEARRTPPPDESAMRKTIDDLPAGSGSGPGGQTDSDGDQPGTNDGQPGTGGKAAPESQP